MEQLNELRQHGGTFEVFVYEDGNFVSRLSTSAQDKFIGCSVQLSRTPGASPIALAANLFNLALAIFLSEDRLRKGEIDDLRNELQYLVDTPYPEESAHDGRPFPF